MLWGSVLEGMHDSSATSELPLPYLRFYLELFGSLREARCGWIEKKDLTLTCSDLIKPYALVEEYTFGISPSTMQC